MADLSSSFDGSEGDGGEGRAAVLRDLPEGSLGRITVAVHLQVESEDSGEGEGVAGLSSPPGAQSHAGLDTGMEPFQPGLGSVPIETILAGTEDIDDLLASDETHTPPQEQAEWESEALGGGGGGGGAALADMHHTAARDQPLLTLPPRAAPRPASDTTAADAAAPFPRQGARHHERDDDAAARRRITAAAAAAAASESSSGPMAPDHLFQKYQKVGGVRCRRGWLITMWGYLSGNG